MDKSQNKQRNNQRGDALISMLLAMTVMAILAAAIFPAVIRKGQIDNGNSAAYQLSQIGAAEFSYAKTYGAYVSPQTIAAGNLALPATCANPVGFLQGQLATPARGYPVPTISNGIAAAQFSCQGIPGYSNFQISLDPTNALQATRHFIFDSATGKIFFTDEKRPATTADHVFSFSIGSSFGASGGSGNTSTGTNTYAGIWTTGQSYQVGQIVLFTPACQGSYPSGGCATGGSSNNGIAFFGNVSGSNSTYPPIDSADWQALGSSLGWTAFPSPGLNGQFTSVAVPSNSFWYAPISTSAIVGPSTFSTFTVQISPAQGSLSNGLIAAILVNASSSYAVSSYFGSPSTGSGLGGSAGSMFYVVEPNDLHSYRLADYKPRRHFDACVVRDRNRS